MNEILRELNMLRPHLLPPATVEDLRKLQHALGQALPRDMVELYQGHGGMAAAAHFPMRLMSPDEVIEAHRERETAASPVVDEQIGLFWTDDNGNFGGVFLAGELSGRVCLIDHEEAEDTPRYWSVESFYGHLLHEYRHGLDWTELTTDYPVLAPETDYPTKEQDTELGRSYLDMLRGSTDRRTAVRHAFRAMNLLPPEETHLIVPLLRSPDMWIQERACQVLGKRRYAHAVHDLYEIAARGTHNGRIAAILALKRIATGSAHEYLEQLRAELAPSYELYFR